MMTHVKQGGEPRRRRQPGARGVLHLSAVRAGLDGVLAHPDHVVLGGTQDEDDENLDPTPALAEEMLHRCVEVDLGCGTWDAAIK